ncbi:nucleoside deaminase [Propionibacteriaceae bacterium G1746]
MDHLEAAIAAATANVTAGGGPFGAVLVAPDGRTFTAANRVTDLNDPTAHAEVMAIRAAGAALGTFDLTGCVLYSSCQPCPMCLAAAQWARLDRVEFAATGDDAAAAGFDDDLILRGLRGEAVLETPVTRAHLDHPDDRLAPFQAWAAHEGKVHY